ncbi:MAG: hypothetical protein IJV68_00555 [Clostridia bacterium]|nr:hypothetical protein [Clostridia bacterium]
MLNTFYDAYSILNKVYSDGAFLKQAMTAVPIEEKNRPAVTKICYGVLDREILLSARINELCDKNPKLVVRTILKIAMYNITFLGKAHYAVTHTAVELCNKLGKKGVSGFVNAVLRKYINYEFKEPSDVYKRLSLYYDYPEFAVKKLVNYYGLDKAEKIMGADGEKTCVRFSKDKNGKEYLTTQNKTYCPTPYENVFFVDKFTRNSDYDKGVYTFQSIGSVAICDAVPAGEALLDACAAPGGKSVLLSDKFKRVTAQELHSHRAELIRDYCARMNIKNVTVNVGDASVFNADYLEGFDVVLCDVPCSGFGVLKENPDIKLKKSDNTINELNELQLAILKNSAKYVKRGGFVCYSTCSIFKEENDGIVKAFLDDDNSFTPEVISSKIPCTIMDFGVQYLPNISFGAGFYVSVLRRGK